MVSALEAGTAGPNARPAGQPQGPLGIDYWLNSLLVDASRFFEN